MDYEFHVGDYVETKTGTIGYVSNVPESGLPLWQATKISDIDRREDMYDLSEAYCIIDEEKRFNRIGQYNFPKKDKKIEKLDKFNDQIYPMVLKINELVDVVNEMREKKCD